MSKTIQIKPLTDTQQGLFLALAIFLPSILVWLNNGAPMTQLALTALGASALGSLFAFVMEALGSSTVTLPPTVAQQVPVQVTGATGVTEAVIINGVTYTKATQPTNG